MVVFIFDTKQYLLLIAIFVFFLNIMNKALLINAFHHLPPFSLQPVASPISDILYPILPPSYQPTNR